MSSWLILVLYITELKHVVYVNRQKCSLGSQSMNLPRLMQVVPCWGQNFCSQPVQSAIFAIAMRVKLNYGTSFWG